MDHTHSASNNPYGQYGQDAAVGKVGEVPLGSTLGATKSAIEKAHAILSEIEDRLHGSMPRAVEGSQTGNSIPAPYPGVVTVANQINKSAEHLSDRLSTLLQGL